MVSRDIINSLLPEGQFWTPADDDYYDNLLEGIAENFETVRLVMKVLGNLRDPAKTTILSDLEKEFSIIPVEGTTEAERRARLAVTMFRRSELPTYERLEETLQAAGFNVYVHANSPAVDPRDFLEENFNMVCGGLLPSGNESQCGEPGAICAKVGGELLVNGELFNQRPHYTFLCGEALAQCGEALAYAGQNDGVYMISAREYVVPAQSGYWPRIFFVGGEATRDPVTNEITNIDIASIPSNREMEFKRIILKYKPLMSWAALIVVYA